MAKSEDELFEEIVENYGPLPQVTDPRQTMKDPAPSGPSILDYEEPYVPPTPPPLPGLTARRIASYGGIFVAPLLAILLITGLLPAPEWLGIGLVFWFCGSVIYLLVKLPTNRDPWDDGAQV
jgi:hypothetical protein